jgi:hypothetical protein
MLTVAVAEAVSVVVAVARTFHLIIYSGIGMI